MHFKRYLCNQIQYVAFSYFGIVKLDIHRLEKLGSSEMKARAKFVNANTNNVLTNQKHCEKHPPAHLLPFVGKAAELLLKLWASHCKLGIAHAHVFGNTCGVSFEMFKLRPCSCHMRGTVSEFVWDSCLLRFPHWSWQKGSVI